MKDNDLLSQFRVKPGKKLRLKDYDPAWTGKHESKGEAEALLAKNLERLSKAQDLLWSTQTYSMLIVLQAMDTAGKDGLITHVMSGMNPQGCQAHPFKQPSEEELHHDFLWKYTKALPARGQIGIFNRSYYEEVLVVRVHPEWLERQKLARKVRGHKLWNERYQDINAYESHLTRNNTVVVKFYLNLSKDEQKRRLQARLDDPKKLWKFSEADLAERAHWDDYMEAYQDAINATTTKDAPWHVIPADHKWVSRWLVSEILVNTVDKLGLNYPKPTTEQAASVQAWKKILEDE